MKIFIRKTRVFNWICSRKRNRKLGKQGNSNGGNSSGIHGLAMGRRISKFFSGRVALYIVASIVVSIIFFHGYTYFQISPQAFQISLEEEVASLMVDQRELHIVVVGMSQRDEYYYIEFLGVFTLDFENNSYNSYIVSPLASYSRSSDASAPNYQYKNYFNNEERLMNGLMHSLEEFLGIRIDRYIAFNTDEFSMLAYEENLVPALLNLQSQDQISSYFFSANDISVGEMQKRQEILSSSFIKRYTGTFTQYWDLFLRHKKFTEIFKTDMSRSELWKFVEAFQSIDQKGKSYLFPSLSEAKLIKEINYALQISIRDIDEVIMEAEKDAAIITEQPELEIYNATDMPGLAGEAKRVIQNVGVKVVKYGNYFEDEDRNVLYVTKDADLYRSSIDAIRRTLRGNVTIVTDEYKYNHTGDLILILGE